MGMAAENPDNFNLASNEQLNAMVTENLGKGELHRINNKKKEVWNKIKNAIEFTDQEKKAIKETLQSGLSDSSIEEINSFSSNIERSRNRISQMINGYFGQLDANQKYFAQREGYNAVDIYKKEFLQLDENGKQKWLEKLHKEIQERVELHEELSQYIAPEQLSRMRRSELRRMQQYVDESNRILAQNKKLFSADEIQSIRTQMADCTTHKNQMRLLSSIVGELEKRKWYMSIYNRLPEKYRNIWGNIAIMSLQERTERYERLLVRIEQDYENLLFNHPDRKHIGSKDRAAALAYVRSDETSGGDKFRAIKNLKKQIQQQKREVSDPFEASLKELAKLGFPRKIKKLRDQFYDAPTYSERKALTEKLKLQVIEAQHKTNEAKEFTKEYSESLSADLSERIIGKRTHKEALKLWNKKTLEEMRETIMIYGKDRERRLKLLKEFHALPQEIQDKNTDFFELTHTDRKERMEELKKDRTMVTKEVTTEKEEEPTNKKIEKLTTLATSAARSQNYKQAIKYYQQILTLDPHDELAAMNLQYVENKLSKQEPDIEENTEEPQKLSSSDLYKVKNIVQAAANTNAILTRRRRNTNTKFIVHEGKKSEAKHGTHKIAGKTTNMSDDDKLLNGQLQEHTGNNYTLQGDEAKKIIWAHEKGMRNKNNPNKEAQIERQIKKDIVESGHNSPYDAIQFYNDSDNVSTASIAEKELEKRDQETRNAILKSAKKHLKNDNEIEAAEEESEKMDLDVKLRAA